MISARLIISKGSEALGRALQQKAQTYVPWRIKTAAVTGIELGGHQFRTGAVGCATTSQNKDVKGGGIRRKAELAVTDPGQAR